MEIKNFQDLIKPTLDKSGKKLLRYECKHLLSSGENYGSVMLQVDVKVVNVLCENREETLHCVAKTCPPTGILWKIFNIEVTFKNEIAIYNTIVPLLNEFGKSKGAHHIMNFFAKYLGSRISLEPNSKIVDKDAVLLLENLKTEGYGIADRFEGFNMECTEMLLRDLAIMHATPIAFKFAKPHEFKTKIMPFLKRDTPFKPDDEFLKNFIKPVEEAARLNPECIPYIGKLVQHLSELNRTEIEPMEPYATVTHNDFWVNNTMLKMNDEKKPERNVIVDFQNIDYNSPTVDLIFFLYTSVSMSVLKDNVDYFIEFYYKHFVETLNKLECDTEPFTFGKFLEEMELVSRKREFTHVLFMLNVIFKRKDKATDLSNFDVNDVVYTADSYHDNYYERLHFVILDFAKRGWI